MQTYTPDQAPQLRALLDRREAELRALLQRSAALAVGAADASSRDVSDFKDAANEESQTQVSDAQTDHARAELDQLIAARHRMAEGSYGLCTRCGESIDLRRLLALPATALCTPCQEAAERHAGPRH